MPKALPSQPNLDWLKKSAKERLAELRVAEPAAKLHQAQLDIARDYGFASWRALKAHVDALSLDGQVIAAAVEGDAGTLGRLLDAHPSKIKITGGQWNRPLLHLAAEGGHIDCVELLLGRGADGNQRCGGRFSVQQSCHPDVRGEDDLLSCRECNPGKLCRSGAR